MFRMFYFSPNRYPRFSLGRIALCASVFLSASYLLSGSFFTTHAQTPGSTYKQEIVVFIDKDDRIDKDNFSASMECGKFLSTVSSTIVSLFLTSQTEGTGTVRKLKGAIMFLDSDPEILNNSSILPDGTLSKMVAIQRVLDSDWSDTDQGALAYIKVNIPFPRTSSIFCVWFHEDPLSLNNLETDDEIVRIQIIYTQN